MASQEDQIAGQTDQEEVDAMVQVLGTDPWARFDVWSARAWEAADNAANISLANGGSDVVDDRIMALFHVAQIAKEFSEMVNPLVAVTKRQGLTASSDSRAQAILAMMLDDSTD